MTHNQNTQPIQCYYAVSKKCINTVYTDTTVESFHFPIYLQIKDKFFKEPLENDIYLPVWYNGFRTKAQPLQQIHQNKIQQFKYNNFLLEIYPVIQHTDVTKNTNNTQTFLQTTQDAIFAELIKTKKISHPAMDDIIQKSPDFYNYFHSEQTQLNDTLLYEAQQQDSVLRQLLLWKGYKNTPPFLH